MPRRWTSEEENFYREELDALYTKENKTIGEVAGALGISQAAAYDRLIRLGIPSRPERKIRFNNQRTDIVVPAYSDDLAEFVGIMLGDGHISSTQVMVTLGTKELAYASYVADLMRKLFGSHVVIRKNIKGYSTVYIGSTKLVLWFKEMGLVNNKVREQVEVPQWIFSRGSFMRAALRGLFDTDGSVYKLRFGTQISFTNHSLPLLRDVRRMLVENGLRPSVISARNVYITRQGDLRLFLDIIGFSNPKHQRRIVEYLTVS